ncbi:MAG: tRNA pseudouridine(54/55) synthase Pus10 [Ferroplasma sp.]
MDEFKDLFSHNLCLRCTGRIFADISSGLTNIDRGNSLRFAYESFYGPVKLEDSCRICNNVFNEFEKYYNIVNSSIKNYDYSTFLIGSKFDPDILLEEARIQNMYGNHGESIKKEFNREFGKYFSSKTGKEFSKDPDILIEVNTIYDNVSLIIRSLYIYGTYIKKRRDIPQTRWINGTGDTVESLIGMPILNMAGGSDYKLHGSGREDVDVMMLGNGREFVLEIIKPLKRNISLEELEHQVNNSGSNIFISNLEYCNKEKIRKIKEAKYDKTYFACIESEQGIDKNKLKAAADFFKNRVIEQRTPQRVMGSRSDLIRKKEIKYISIEAIEDKIARIKICSESGTYIKELINGDDGRTNPNLSSVYGSNLRVASLDVINIER